MTVEEYREQLLEDMAVAAAADGSSTPDKEFLYYVTDILATGEEFDDFIECHQEGISHKRANMEIDGYAFDDTDGSCCVFILDYHGPFENDSINAKDIDIKFNLIRHFIEEAIKYKMGFEESSQEYEFNMLLHEKAAGITKFRFYILTDAYNRQRVKNIKDIEIAGINVERNVWDISRIFDIISSTTQKESVEIIFDKMGIEGISCVKAVEYENVKADIEVAIKYEDESVRETIPDNIITYTSYLAVVPGQVLNDLYIEFGSRLLEGNVRSFLSARGKVNKSIQNTIKNYPEMFFAYNNGIAATATEIDTEMTQEGLVIKRIKDLQIVNGGQTTASIAYTLLTQRKDDNIDISKLSVPMKISVLEHSMSERIIPKISEYSNSQNKVDASDFFSNHPFHIRMEEYSRKTPAPAVQGNQYQQYWYYERAKGQYNQGKMKFKPKSSQMKQYEMRYPASQVIKLVDLAKYMEIYNCVPHIVSKGKQALVRAFSNEIKKQWDKSDEVFNVYYFKRVISLAIIFKATDEIIRQKVWWKEKHSYKANVIAYAMSILFDYIQKNCKDYTLDFIKIWSQQSIYQELWQQMAVLCDEVYEYITEPSRMVENVTEWCKRELCWEKAQDRKWSIQDAFIKTLILVSEIKDIQKDAKAGRKIANEVDDLKYIISAGESYWKQVYEWGKERKLLTDMEDSLLKMARNISITGKVPSDRQAKVIIRTKDRLIEDGMPLTFS